MNNQDAFYGFQKRVVETVMEILFNGTVAVIDPLSGFRVLTFGQYWVVRKMPEAKEDISSSAHYRCTKSIDIRRGG